MTPSRSSAPSKITDTLRSLAGALVVAARQFSPLRLAAILFGVAVVVAVATVVHLPTPVQLRDWAESLGAWFPLAFLAAHIVITIVPVPRTAFTLASGLLFGPVLGVAIAVVASTASAIIALLLVRAAGLQLNRLVKHRAMHNVDDRLRERGWRSVLSLRLLPLIPFAPLNYAAGASGVGVVPFTLATVVGLLPGTIAIVTLGDALADHVNPLLYVASVCIGALGAMGLLLEFRHYRQTHRRSRAALS